MRFLDITISMVGLILASPILLIFAAIIKFDGGPVFFRQERVGYKGQAFKILKFRSMIVNADDYLNSDGLATRNRVTNVGKVMRKLSIDELPQFVNVLSGEMSLIGPRPILPNMLPFLTVRERQRFCVRPGITGLAQVKGRNFLKWSRRFNFDLIYVKKRSLQFNIWIISQTIKVILLRSGVASDRNSRQVDDITTRLNVVEKELEIE